MSKATMNGRRGKTETGQDRFLEFPPFGLHPAPENSDLYRPVHQDDPEIVALAESIREHGLQEPIVTTREMVIISGHRRHAACCRLRLDRVACRVLDVSYRDPEFIHLLKEFNRQRVKTIDEVLREQVLDIDPKDAHYVLIEYREQRARVDTQTIELPAASKRSRISKAKEPMLRAARAVIYERKAFWPLIDRSIHYALLNDPPLRHASKPKSTYANTMKCYKDLTDLLTRARVEGEIPYNVIHDPTRPVQLWNLPENAGAFIRQKLNGFLKGYYRNLLQSQPNHIEIVGEKLAIESIVKPVASHFTIPYTIGRGFTSLSPRFEMAERFRKSGKDKLVIIFLTDHDPEGESIPSSFAKSMRDDFGVDPSRIEPVKAALTRDQVQGMNLATDMEAKRGSSRYKDFVRKYGTDVYELEAIPPADLQTLLQEAIDSVLDVDLFNAEVRKEEEEAVRLEQIRQRVNIALRDIDLSTDGDEGEDA